MLPSCVIYYEREIFNLINFLVFAFIINHKPFTALKSRQRGKQNKAKLVLLPLLTQTMKLHSHEMKFRLEIFRF